LLGAAHNADDVFRLLLDRMGTAAACRHR
jgi:hypothetical protein